MRDNPTQWTEKAYQSAHHDLALTRYSCRSSGRTLSCWLRTLGVLLHSSDRSSAGSGLRATTATTRITAASITLPTAAEDLIERLVELARHVDYVRSLDRFERSHERSRRP